MIRNNHRVLPSRLTPQRRQRFRSSQSIPPALEERAAGPEVRCQRLALLSLDIFIYYLSGVLLSLLLLSCSNTSQAQWQQFGSDSLLSSFLFSAWSPSSHWLAVLDTHQVRILRPDGQSASLWNADAFCDLDPPGPTFSWLSGDRLVCLDRAESHYLWFSIDSAGHLHYQSQAPLGLSLSSSDIPLFINANPRYPLIALIVFHNQERLFLSDLQGHQLPLPVPIYATAASWSWDGTQLAVIDQASTITIYQLVQRASGLPTLRWLRRLPLPSSDSEPVAWSPSGRWLVCRHGTYESEDYLFLQATDGSGRSYKLSSSYRQGQLFAPAWSPDGRLLVATQVSTRTLYQFPVSAWMTQQHLTP